MVMARSELMVRLLTGAGHTFLHIFQCRIIKHIQDYLICFNMLHYTTILILTFNHIFLLSAHTQTSGQRDDKNLNTFWFLLMRVLFYFQSLLPLLRHKFPLTKIHFFSWNCELLARFSNHQLKEYFLYLIYELPADYFSTWSTYFTVNVIQMCYMFWKMTCEHCATLSAHLRKREKPGINTLLV